METPLKTKRNYTKRTKLQRMERLKAQLETLKACHKTRSGLISKLEAKLTANQLAKPV